MRGLEPPRPEGHRHLKPARLPSSATSAGRAKTLAAWGLTDHEITRSLKPRNAGADTDVGSNVRTQGWANESGQDRDGQFPLPDDVVQLRRVSDWSDEPRPDDEAAEAAYRAALAMATATLAEHDGGTASHSDDVVTLTIALAEEMGVHDRDRAYLLAAAELHDIGKVGVPPQILSKPAPLDEGEWEVVREHTITGERILGAVPELREVASIVRHCHERWDGEGYPDGLRGEQIPLSARIVFCADAYHAIRGDRPYRRGRSARAALAEVKKHSGTQFDPEVVSALAHVAARLRERRTAAMTPVFTGHRSQRLAALLLTLTISGSALAATGIWNPSGGEASDDVGQSKTRDAPLQGPPASDKARADDDKAGKRKSPRGQRGRPAPASVPAAKDDSSGQSGAVSSKGAAKGKAAPVRRSPSGSVPGASPKASPPARSAPKKRAVPAPPSALRPSPGAPAPKVPAPAPAPAPSPAPVDDDVEDGSNGHGKGHDGHGKGHDGHH